MDIESATLWAWAADVRGGERWEAILWGFQNPNSNYQTLWTNLEKPPRQKVWWSRGVSAALDVNYILITLILYRGSCRHSCCCCSVTKPCPTLCNAMDCSTPGFPVLYYLPEFAQTHVHWIGDAIQPSHPLSPPTTSPPAFNLSQHQGFFQCVSSSSQVAKVLELQLQHQFFQWIFRVHFL